MSGDREPRDPRGPSDPRDPRDPRTGEDPRDPRDERAPGDPRDAPDDRPLPAPLPAIMAMWRRVALVTAGVLVTIGLVAWGASSLVGTAQENRRLSERLCQVQQETREAEIRLVREGAEELIDQAVMIARSEGRTADAERTERLRERYVTGQVERAERVLPEITCPPRPERD